MSDDAPFLMLDEAAIKAAELRRDPYDYTFIENAISTDHKAEVLADVPVIPDRGSYALANLRYGQKFGNCMQDLLSPRFRRLVEQKFDIDLSNKPASIVMMGNTTGHYNEGYAHPDSKHKIITVLLGFTAEWPHERGRLRVLRSNDRDDYAFEFAPEFGKMLMFRVCDHSWHGFLPQKGNRMSVQLCYVDSEWYVHRENIRHGLSSFAKSIPVVRQIIDWMPRSFGNKG
ncbi:2OG-Fe(II) oxygenase [Acidocella sp.]|uniref:2OG-Fe(II) oxygenase n=1 Tax=Acidocella sp. TaxID=50710 RepID=UPI0017C4CFED|nr:2OG-Fe(II) oxygenase [Acidocella sp.]NNM57233.1 2OG-Fe(II) oxygenase [Acidocella sp.]